MNKEITGDMLQPDGSKDSSKKRRFGSILEKSQKKRDARDLRAVSNIHQLYQDLFITDMKDEIAVASSEVIQLRQELLDKEK